MSGCVGDPSGLGCSEHTSPHELELKKSKRLRSDLWAFSTTVGIFFLIVGANPNRGGTAADRGSRGARSPRKKAAMAVKRPIAKSTTIPRLDAHYSTAAAGRAEESSFTLLL